MIWLTCVKLAISWRDFQIVSIQKENKTLNQRNDDRVTSLLTRETISVYFVSSSTRHEMNHPR